ncbi:hypothetical protein LCGC14_0661770 [marine sediment metagenome]|uniref:Rubrerythrin diiron-binding domain-containing protein n=1 Tax=marine sediment metagenome TaxID=412755 RepID=A0A0F9RDF0_9ZZZZ|nr:hypothetical protein [Candidatus Aminicenantes bacterium]HEB36112.1 hypothetical protein [Candidatus Aminicenantes bacterium]
MATISQQVKDAIKGAILLEVNGRKFFNHAADVTKHESGKKMFRFLAEEEVKHLKTFTELFGQILGSKDWRKHLSSHELEGEAPLVEKLKERMKREEGKGETEAISIGMQLEMDAINFFFELHFNLLFLIFILLYIYTHKMAKRFTFPTRFLVLVDY